MAFAWMFLPHVIRGIIGLIIVLVKGLPKSDEIIEHVKIENLSETLQEDIGKGVISYIKEIQKLNQIVVNDQSDLIKTNLDLNDC